MPQQQTKIASDTDALTAATTTQVTRAVVGRPPQAATPSGPHST